MHPFFRKLSWLAQRKRKEAEMSHELEFHLAEEAEERKIIGLTEEDARFAARRDLGSLALIREDTSATWGWPLLEQFAQDVRQGSRALVRSPTFALTAIVTFALGIGMTTAIFSVVYGMLLRPLPLHESDRLVVVSTIDGTDVNGAVSPPNFMSLAENIDAGSGSFSHIAGFTDTEVTLTGAGEARRIRGARVSARFFETLNAVTILGRTFRREEHDAGLGHVAVLSHALWQQHFGSDRGVIGRPVILNGVPHALVGIMAPGFAFPYGGDFWIPQSYTGYYSSASIAARKNNALVGVIARLRPDVRLDTARRELGVLGRRLEEAFPQTNANVTFSAIGAARRPGRRRSIDVASVVRCRRIGALDFHCQCGRPAARTYGQPARGDCRSLGTGRRTRSHPAAACDRGARSGYRRKSARPRGRVLDQQ